MEKVNPEVNEFNRFTRVSSYTGSNYSNSIVFSNLCRRISDSFTALNKENFNFVVKNEIN